MIYICKNCKSESNECYDPDECRCEKCTAHAVAYQEYLGEQVREQMWQSLGYIFNPNVSLCNDCGVHHG